MKKLLFLMTMVAMASCGINPDKTHGRSMDNATVFEIAPTTIYKFKYAGHSYIGFPWGKSAGYAHDANCPCQVQLRERVDSILTMMYD